ncbi:hypothetical protein KAU33_15590 [Candidatus Dependentiae bacterium]|nr:hypothetical protein [Candidatus Dependentiae bacterium]
MLWKLDYSDYRVESELAHGKTDALSKAFRTLMSYPYLSVDLYKFKDDKKIYVTTYEMRKKWGKDWKLVEKKKR